MENYVAEMQREFPRLVIRSKIGHFPSRLISGFLMAVTLGGQRRYVSDFATTLGSTIYVPARWPELLPEQRYLTLRHEAVHLRQFQRLGWFRMAFLYLFPLFPVGLALGRARLEWEAYREGLFALAELRGVAAAHDSRVRAAIVSQFVGASYGFMWPFPDQVHRWIDEALSTLQGDSGVPEC